MIRLYTDIESALLLSDADYSQPSQAMLYKQQILSQMQTQNIL